MRRCSPNDSPRFLEPKNVMLEDFYDILWGVLFYGPPFILAILWLATLVVLVRYGGKIPGIGLPLALLLISPLFPFVIFDSIDRFENPARFFYSETFEFVLLGGAVFAFFIGAVVALKRLPRGTSAKKAVVSYVCVLLAFSIGLGILAMLPTGHPSPRDARRLSNMQQIALAMELYNDYNDGRYPIIEETGAAGFNAISSILLEREFIPVIPEDPSYTDPPRFYEGASPDGKTYLLKATLDEFRQPLLSDYDGMLFGLDCGREGNDEREFCICNGAAC